MSGNQVKAEAVAAGADDWAQERKMHQRRMIEIAEEKLGRALSRAGALDGLSIGFRTGKARRDGRLRVLSGVELWEVSLVTFPMLPGARFRVEGR